jgi:hypothetical protein
VIYRDGDIVKIEIVDDEIHLTNSPGPNSTVIPPMGTQDTVDTDSEQLEQAVPLEVVRDVQDIEMESGDDRRRRLLS